MAASFDYETLTKQAKVDPQNLLAKLGEGSPEEIGTLAAAFAKASTSAEDSAGQAAKATGLKAEGYTINEKSVVNEDADVAKTKAQLGGGGEKLAQIAKTLDSLAGDLSKSTASASKRCESMYQTIKKIAAEGDKAWDKYNSAHHQQIAPSERDSERDAVYAPFVKKAVGEVKSAGADVTKTIQGYEKQLSTALKSMATLGYIPPDDLDEGPGDVDLDKQQAADDADAFKKGLNENGQNSLDDIATGEQTVTLLNAKVATGQPLTEKERAYLNAWYNDVGAKNLAALPDHVGRQIPNNEPADVQSDTYKEYVSPVADGIMNYSHEYTNNDGKMVKPTGQDMPSAVMQLINQPIGYYSQHDKKWHANESTPTIDSTHIDGLDRYRGFASLMNSTSLSVQSKSDAFSETLGRSAIRVQQETNDIIRNERNCEEAFENPSNYQKGNTAETSIKALQELDNGASTMMHVVSRNINASQALMDNDTTRHEILAARWNDEKGAADVVDTATSRYEDTAAHAQRSAKITMEMFTDLAKDPEGWRKSIPKGGLLSNEITNVGMDYIDVFGTTDDQPTSQTRWSGRPTGTGHFVSSFDFSRADRIGFMEFISSDGAMNSKHADPDVTKMYLASDLYNIRNIAEAYRSGDAGKVDNAIQEAANIDGAIMNGDYRISVKEGRQDLAARQEMYDNKVTTGLIAKDIVDAGVSMIPKVGDILSGIVNVAWDSQQADIARHRPTEISSNPNDVLKQTTIEHESHRNYVVAAAMNRAGVLLEQPPEYGNVNDRNAAESPSMLNPDGSLKSLAQIRKDGNSPRLGQWANQSLPGIHDKDGNGLNMQNKLNTATEKWKNYLPSDSDGTPSTHSPDDSPVGTTAERDALRYGHHAKPKSTHGHPA